MSKLEIEFELTGLKLRIKGEKEDIPNAIAALQRQLSAVIQPPVLLASGDGHPPHGSDDQAVYLASQLDPATEDVQPAPLQRRRGAGRRGGSSSRQSVAAIDFRHDPQKCGFPKQEWNTAQKAMWLMYALELHADHKEASAAVLAATFKKYFKEFGNILSHNVNEIWGKRK